MGQTFCEDVAMNRLTFTAFHSLLFGVSVTIHMEYIVVWFVFCCVHPAESKKKNVAIQLLCLCPTNCTRMDSIIVFLLTCVLGGDCWESHSWYIMIHMYISINICVYLHIHLCIYQRLRFRGIFGRFTPMFATEEREVTRKFSRVWYGHEDTW